VEYGSCLSAVDDLDARVLHAVGAAIIVTDLTGEIIFWNEAATDLFGWSAGEAIGANSIDLTVTGARAPDSEAIMDQLRAGRPWSGEFMLRDRRGRSFPALVTDTPIFDETGQLCAIVGVSVDLTAQRNTEDALRASETLHRRVFLDGIDAIARLVELRDPYLDGHQRRVGDIAAHISARLGFDERFIEGIRIAGQIHDIGKIAIPAEILARPGPLSPAELDLVRGHCQAGYDVIKEINSPWPIATVTLQHHERIDGSGYPHGLIDGEIAIQSRIVAVADVLEAASSHRPYRPSQGLGFATELLQAQRGCQLDPDAVDACTSLLNDGTIAAMFTAATTDPGPPADVTVRT
jgi:PAS domain S-box-containing protein